MADRVGFEPTSRLRDYLISSQGRYDLFDTCPYKSCELHSFYIIHDFAHFVNTF